MDALIYDTALASALWRRNPSLSCILPLRAQLRLLRVLGCYSPNPG